VNIEPRTGGRQRLIAGAIIGQSMPIAEGREVEIAP